MRLEDFTADTIAHQSQGDTFSPCTINCEWRWEYPPLNVLLEKTAYTLAELKGYSYLQDNVASFVDMHILKEGCESLLLEGDEITLQAALENPYSQHPHKHQTAQKLQRFKAALQEALSSSTTPPLSVPSLKSLYATMTGKSLATLRSSVFRSSLLPTEEHPLTASLMISVLPSDLEKHLSDIDAFWNDGSLAVPYLVRIALIHYQLMILQPFNATNGPLIRLLTLGLLKEAGFMNDPWLCLSHSLRQHQSAYYGALMKAQHASQIIPWIMFFLNTLLEAAMASSKRLRTLLDFKHETNEKLASLKRRTSKAHDLIAFLYTQPLINAKQAGSITDLVPASTNALLRHLIEIKILQPLTAAKRNRLFIVHDYVRLFQG